MFEKDMPTGIESGVDGVNPAIQIALLDGTLVVFDSVETVPASRDENANDTTPYVRVPGEPAGPVGPIAPVGPVSA